MKTHRRHERVLRRISLALMPLFLAQPRPSFPGEFDSALLGRLSLNPECVEYCIVGLCLWLVCTPLPVPACHVETSPRIRNRLPDLVVQSYPHAGNMPWVEMRETLGPVLAGSVQAIMGTLAGTALTGGGEDVLREDPNEGDPGRAVNLLFKEGSVIGNPYAYAISKLGMGYICPASTEPFYPYFQSEFDALVWCLVLAELLYPASWIPGQREIGTWPLNSWGPVHPRHGFLLQYEDHKAGAVMAQRSVDIATRADQPHLYTQAPDIEPSDEQSDWWQMLTPEPSMECKPFGEDEWLLDPDHTAQHGRYGWLYWARHECCQPHVGIYIGWIPTPPICF